MRGGSALFALLVLSGGCASPIVEVDLPDVRVRVEPDIGTFSLLSPDGSLLLEGVPRSFGFRSAEVTAKEGFGSFLLTETAPDWQHVGSFHHVVKLADGLSFETDGGGTGEIHRIAEGTVQLVWQMPPANRVTASFRCTPDEQFLGFGAMPEDVQHRGTTVPIFTSEQGIGRVDTDDPPSDWYVRGTRHQSYFPIPFFLSSANYGVRADTSARSLFAMCSETPDAWRVEAWEGKLSLTLFFGASPLEVIRRHSDLEGRAPPPPAFTFAPWNDAIHGSANVRRVAQVLRDNHIPSSVIWTEDWAGATQSGDNYNLTYNWSVDRTLYPDVELLASDLHNEGFKFLGYFNTFTNLDGDHFAAGQAGRFLVEGADGTPYTMEGVQLNSTSLVDLTNPSANDWMAESLDAAIDLGFDGWMADFGEWLPVDGKLASGEDPWLVHNRYPLLWQKLNEQVLSGRTDGVDRLVFVRSGSNGSQPIAHQVVWGGDQSTDFDPGDGLPSVLPIALGLGVAGMPCFGSDIAGYMTGASGGFGTKELFYRWSVLGALSPVMRTHHGVASTKNWNFESDAETLAHYHRWAQLHIRLYPYLRDAAMEASQDGAPMMRQLALAFPEDKMAWTIKDEYLLGPSLLVAPVLAAGVTSRSIYLPTGHWVPLFGATNGVPIDGPGTFDVSAPLGELPIMARPGTLIALLSESVETLVGPIDPAREIVTVLGADGQLTDGAASYQLSSSKPPDPDQTLEWNGAPLSECATPPLAPCGSVDDGARQALAQVSGPGTLTFGDSALTTTGAVPKALAIRMRW